MGLLSEHIRIISFEKDRYHVLHSGCILWYPSCCIHATVRQGSCLLCESSLEVCSRHPGCDIAMEEEDLELGV